MLQSSREALRGAAEFAERLSALDYDERGERAAGRPSVRVGFIAAILAVFAVPFAAPVEAQSVTGRVIDAVTQEGIGFVRVSLVGGNGVVAATSTDSAGYFVLQGVPGLHRVQAEHLGYAKRTGDPLSLGTEETIRVVIRMAPQGIVLPPIEVTWRGRFERGRDGFERRMALSKGVFLNPDSIRLREPVAVTDAFHGIPGVTVSFRDKVASMTGGKCFTFFVDNHIEPQINVNQLLSVTGIRGIEVYRNLSEVPVELRTAGRFAYMYPSLNRGEPCGLVWIWTRHGW